MLAKVWHELQDKHMKDISEFPVEYAFNKEQLQEALKKLRQC